MKEGEKKTIEEVDVMPHDKKCWKKEPCLLLVGIAGGGAMRINLEIS